MNKELENIIDGLENLRGKFPPPTKDSAPNVTVALVIQALNAFTDCVRYLNTRRSGGALLSLDSEADVQDALYLMLRPWIIDLVPENPTDKIGNRYSIKDFSSKSSRIVIEAKFIRNNEHGKSIVKEINDDIETYRYHPFCNDLIFFIYDPNAHIPDSASLIRHINSKRTYEDKSLECHGIIKP